MTRLFLGNLKTLLVIFASLVFLSQLVYAASDATGTTKASIATKQSATTDKTKTTKVGTAYDYTFKTLLEEKPMPLSKFKGKVLLIVNTASKCGFTGQYAGLEKLYETFRDQGLVIVGVPSNDFGGQEPGTNEEIANFCQSNFNVSFPMASKEVVSGDQAHPFYLWAKKVLGPDSVPKWNFHKYLIDTHGKLVQYFVSNTEPNAPNLVDAIEGLLVKGV